MDETAKFERMERRGEAQESLDWSWLNGQIGKSHHHWHGCDTLGMERAQEGEFAGPVGLHTDAMMGNLLHAQSRQCYHMPKNQTHVCHQEGEQPRAKLLGRQRTSHFHHFVSRWWWFSGRAATTFDSSPEGPPRRSRSSFPVIKLTRSRNVYIPRQLK